MSQGYPFEAHCGELEKICIVPAFLDARLRVFINTAVFREKRVRGRIAWACLLCAWGRLAAGGVAAEARTDGSEGLLSVRVAKAAMERWPHGHIAAKNAEATWGFEPGIVLCGMNAVWSATRDRRYFDYLLDSVDQFVAADGSIRTYDARAYSLNNILIGRQLLTLYRATGEEKYRKAADALHQQLMRQPTTASGGYWHEEATPNLMLLDDEFMFAPFLAEYAVMFRQPGDLEVVTKQFRLLAAHAGDAKTGLLYHGWDASRSRAWVNPDTGDSATLWSRGMGWYLMALADTLPWYAKDSAGRAELLGIFQRIAAAVIRAQDADSGLWLQVLDKPGIQGNYFESSSAMMFVYALEKGVRLGYLPAAYGASTARAWKAMRTRFVRSKPGGEVVITGTVTHIALGETPADNGTYDYYLHAPVASDDPKGVGAFLLAATEMELAGRKFAAVRAAEASR